MDPLTPKNHGEEVAVFRHGLIGAIALRLLTHGERISLLRSISEQRVRPPGSDTTRCYSVTTLERWLYAFERGGLEAGGRILGPDHVFPGGWRFHFLDPVGNELAVWTKSEA